MSFKDLPKTTPVQAAAETPKPAEAKPANDGKPAETKPEKKA